MFVVGWKVDVGSLLEKLHWLPVKKKIIFKVLLYVYTKLSTTLRCPTCRNALHFINLFCQLSSKELTAIGRKNFKIAAAYAWNDLSKNIGLAPSIAAFKRPLKTHLF